MKKYWYIFFTLLLGSFLGFISLTSCDNKGEQNKAAIDSSAVIEAGLDHLFKSQRFAADFYANPVKIVKSPRVPNDLKFSVNGKQVELVPRREGRGAYIDDLEHPLPFVDVTKLVAGPDGGINLELEFPTIGFVYEIILVPDKKPTWKVQSSNFFQT